MKNLLEMHEFLLNERRASALTLLNDVVGGRTSSVEGIKLSVGMASAFLDWARNSPYGRKYNKLPFNMLFTAAFVWGLDRYVKGKDLKNEYKELKAKAKEMRKNESLDEKRSTPYGELMLDIDAAMKKAIKKGVTTLRYAKDYIQSLERMAKKNAKQFFKDYGDFSEDDWIEDVRYNMANEKVDEGLLGKVRSEIGKTQTALKKKWKKTGGYENFGQDEISKLQDRYGYSSMVYGTPEQRKAAKLIDALDQWAMNYVGESVNEAKFVKSYNTKVNDAETEKDVKKIYPKYKKIGVGKLTHFFGELEPNLFFKARYPKYYKQDTGKSVKGDFKIVSVYSFRNGNGVELMKESELNEIRAKKVTKQMWKKFSDDKRFDALLSVIKDPDDAEEYVFMRWEELPGWMHRDMTLFEKDYSTEQRKEMAAKGLALPDGSFPIKDIKDLKNAILSYGRSTDHSEVAKFIAKRAKALGAEDLIPDTENFQKALKETDKKGEYIPYYESFKQSLLEKKPKGAPDFHHSDAPDAEGRFRDLSPKDLAAWLIKTRKKDLKKISGSLTQQVVFNRNDDPKYADKMEKTRIEVYKQLGREDLLDKKD